MRPIPHFPRPSPLDRDAFLRRGSHHDFGEFNVKRPVPPHFAADQNRQVDGVTCQVARAHRLRRARRDELLLSRHRAQALSHDEVCRPRCLTDDAMKVRVDLAEQHLGFGIQSRDKILMEVRNRPKRTL